MKLNLKNPIVFFDLETTGTNINSDRIVEICYLKVYPNGNEETKTMRINPEMHIPEEASAVHGIYDADVAECPTFKEVARMGRSICLSGIVQRSGRIVTGILYYLPWRRLAGFCSQYHGSCPGVIGGLFRAETKSDA